MRRSKQTQNKRGIGSLLKLLRYVARFKWRILLILLAVLAANLVGLRIPDITGQLVDCMAAPGGVDFSALGWGVLEIVFLALVTFGLSALQNILMLKTAQDLVLSLRLQSFAFFLVGITPCSFSKSAMRCLIICSSSLFLVRPSNSAMYPSLSSNTALVRSVNRDN